jgi:hypothetical protein
MRPESVRLRSYGLHHVGNAPGVTPAQLLPHFAAIAADVRSGMTADAAIARHTLSLRRTIKKESK